MKKIFTLLGVTLAILLVGQAQALSQTPSGSDFYYVGDTKECQVIDYMCEDGWDNFSDNNGCGCKKISDPTPKACPENYDPVCGMPYFECPWEEGIVCSIPMLRTYSNICFLESENASFQYDGICEHDTPVEPKTCPEYWAPVCGKTAEKTCMGPGCASEYKTFSNKQCLEAEDAVFQYEGECRDEPPLPEPTKTKYYVGDTKKCQLIKYRCEDGWNYFSDEIGCGCEKKGNELSITIQNKLVTIVQTFIQSLEKKGYRDGKNIEIIDAIILKLELLAQQDKYRAIVDYTILLLEKQKVKYEDDFNIIEKIFENF